VVLVSVVRNGAVHVDDFLEHHFRLGVRHAVLLMNRSSDDTAARAARHGRVTVLRCDVRPFIHKYEFALRRYLIRRFARGRWCLVADIDERFDYPYSDRLPLPSLVSYLTAKRYTAVVAQLLDLFPERPLTRADASRPFVPSEHGFYDLSDVQWLDYGDARFDRERFNRFDARRNRVTNPAIRFCVGGIRKRAFGTDNWLTKHPLVFADRRLHITDSAHWVHNVRCADFSAVLRHYKFAGDAHGTARGYAESHRFPFRQEYVSLADALERGPVALKAPTARPWRGAAALVDEGFLAASDQFRRWAAQAAGAAC
jgi:hypothetical protein